MMIIEILCLYLKEYLSTDQFEELVYDHLSEFEKLLDEDIYLELITTNFSSKESRISLFSRLHEYVLEKYEPEYHRITDAYIERMIDSGRQDRIVNILQERYRKSECVTKRRCRYIFLLV